VRTFLQSFCAKARGGWFRHFSWSVGLIPIPLDRIKEIHKFKIDVPEQDYIDKEIAKLYGLTDDELRAFHSFRQEITSYKQELMGNDKENELLD
jgi:hypothetical protein